MISKQHIENLASRQLEGTKLFVTSVSVSSENHINVFIDGDEGVKISDCVELSRALEASLDREKEDFSLDVSSHGATTPLVTPRQYRRHIGRDFEVKLNGGEKVEGRLESSSDEGISLVFSVRENKPIGKGKITVEKRRDLKFPEIKEARIKLKY